MPLSASNLADRLVDQLAVFDAFDAGGKRLPDGARRIGVHRDIRALIVGRFDGGADLWFGELRRLDRIVRRGNTAAGHELDLAGALPQLLPCA